MIFKDAPGSDASLMNMAIMDVAILDPLVQALPTLLNKGGAYAFDTTPV